MASWHGHQYGRRKCNRAQTTANSRPQRLKGGRYAWPGPPLRNAGLNPAEGPEVPPKVPRSLRGVLCGASSRGANRRFRLCPSFYARMTGREPQSLRSPAESASVSCRASGTYGYSLGRGKFGSSVAASSVAQEQTAVQSRRSLAGSLPASRLIGKPSFVGSCLPPDISSATGLGAPSSLGGQQLRGGVSPHE